MPSSTPRGYRALLTLTAPPVAVAERVGDGAHVMIVRFEQQADQALRQMTLLQRIVHPNLPAVVEVGRDGRGAFAVAQWTPGVTLGALLAGYRDGLLPVDVCSRIGAAVARAVHGLRRGGVEVPHPLSLDDVWVGFDGSVRLMPLFHRVGAPASDSVALAELGKLLFQLITGEPPGEEIPLVSDLRRDAPAAIELLIAELVDAPEAGRDAEAIAHELDSISLEHERAEGATSVVDILRTHFADTERSMHARLRAARRPRRAATVDDRIGAAVRARAVLFAVAVAAVYTWLSWQAVLFASRPE